MHDKLVVTMTEKNFKQMRINLIYHIQICSGKTMTCLENDNRRENGKLISHIAGKV